MALSSYGGPARVLALAVQPGVCTNCDKLERNVLGIFGYTDDMTHLARQT
jgi:hypothetical protein